MGISSVLKNQDSQFKIMSSVCTYIVYDLVLSATVLFYILFVPLSQVHLRLNVPTVCYSDHL